MSALLKIRKAGFDVSLFGDSFQITQSSKLTIQQRAFLKSHKAEIITELISETMPPKLQVFNYRVTDKPDSDLTVIMPNTTLSEAKEKLTDKYGDRLLTVTCYTPNGKPIEVQATSQEHAVFLKCINPSPTNTRNINP
jgi:hypothetical protein